MKTLKNIFAFILIMIIAAAGLFITRGYFKYRSALDAVPISVRVEEVRSNTSYCEISELPPMYIDAVIAVEDRRFYYHGGFDIIGMARAVITDIRNRSLDEGGSTISQQLAKNLYFPQDNTLERKIAEIFMAVKLEREYEKEEILELYFNCIYYGSGYYCVRDAANGYFGKEPSEMDDYECTLLAGVPNAPSKYSPKVNPTLAHKRQQKVLSTMVDCGYIDDGTADAIVEKQR